MDQPNNSDARAASGDRSLGLESLLLPRSQKKCLQLPAGVLHVRLPLKSETFWWPQPPVLSQKYCSTNGRRTAAQLGGALQYKWYWLGFPFFKVRSQEGTAIQMGGVTAVQIGGVL